MAVALVSVVAVESLAGLARLIEKTRALEMPFWIYLLPALEFAVLAGLALCLWKRKGWARWVLLVLAVLQFSMTAFSAMMVARLRDPAGVDWNPLTYLPMLIAPGCLVAATGLVFGPARAWFRKQS